GRGGWGRGGWGGGGGGGGLWGGGGAPPHLRFRAVGRHMGRSLVGAAGQRARAPTGCTPRRAYPPRVGGFRESGTRRLDQPASGRRGRGEAGARGSRLGRRGGIVRWAVRGHRLRGRARVSGMGSGRRRRALPRL